MEPITTRLERAIGSLREKFIAGLPARIDRISGELHSATPREVERGFHTLAGTAATYGMFGIAAVAREGEQECLTAESLDVERLERLLKRLREIAAGAPVREENDIDDDVQELLDRDGLTGLLTRGAFEHRAEAAAGLARRCGSAVALIFLDLDNFRSVNDRFGRPTGDAVLRSFAGFLTRNLRSSDAVARYNGEEFTVLLPDMQLENTHNLIARMADAFGSVEQTAMDRRPFHITFSAGVAMLAPQDDVARWIARADDALDAAKRTGRGRVEAA